MGLRNTATEWGTLAKGFHWLSAVLTIFLVAFGWWMIHVAERAERLANFGIHASIGYDLLLLLALRLCWRAIDRGPALPADFKTWEKGAAHLGHFLLYFLMLAVTVTGWMIVSSARRPIDASYALVCTRNSCIESIGGMKATYPPAFVFGIPSSTKLFE